MCEIRSIFLLKREEIVRAARDQAAAGEPMRHGFAPGSTQAATFERAYTERRREIDALLAEQV